MEKKKVILNMLFEPFDSYNHRLKAWYTELSSCQGLLAPVQASSAATQRPVGRINPDWVGWLEVQCWSSLLLVARGGLHLLHELQLNPMWVALDC